MPPLSTSYHPSIDELDDLLISDPESENEFEYRSIPSRLYTISEESSESEAEAGTMNLDHGRDELDTRHDAEAKAAASVDKGPREENEEMDLDDKNETMVENQDSAFDLVMILAGARIGDGRVYRVPMIKTDDEDEGEDGTENDGETSRSDRAAARALECGQAIAGIVRAGKANEGFDEYDADVEDVEG